VVGVVALLLVCGGGAPPILQNKHPRGNRKGKNPPKNLRGQEREIRRRRDEAFSEIEIERKRYDKIRVWIFILLSSTARVFI